MKCIYDEKVNCDNDPECNLETDCLGCGIKENCQESFTPFQKMILEGYDEILKRYRTNNG